MGKHSHIPIVTQPPRDWWLIPKMHYKRLRLTCWPHITSAGSDHLGVCDCTICHISLSFTVIKALWKVNVANASSVLINSRSLLRHISAVPLACHCLTMPTTSLHNSAVCQHPVLHHNSKPWISTINTHLT